MAAAVRKQLVAVVALVVALLLVAGAAAQDCGVGGGTMEACLSYCRKGGNSDACCGPMKSADMGCLCNYWREYRNNPYFANCATMIRKACKIHGPC